jgi:hypothetical protein
MHDALMDTHRVWKMTFGLCHTFGFEKTKHSSFSS